MTNSCCDVKSNRFVLVFDSQPLLVDYPKCFIQTEDREQNEQRGASDNNKRPCKPELCAEYKLIVILVLTFSSLVSVEIKAVKESCH